MGFRFLGRLKRSRTTRASLAPRTRLMVEALESRVVPYALSGDAWPSPQLITISFVPDGTFLGYNNNGAVYSNLFATMNSRFGSPSVWENQILKAAQVWAQQTNINFSLVSDDGVAFGSGNYQQGDPNMGDIRISGFNFGSNVLGFTDMPPPGNNTSIAGDVELNTGVGWSINGGMGSDLFTVASHEIGHALGLYESSVSAAIMFGSYTTRKTALNSDDIAGIRAIYSNGNARSLDQYNQGTLDNTFATATNVSSMIDPNYLTAVVTGLNITTTSTVEYLTFTAPQNTTSNLTITVQSQGLSLLSPNMTVYAANQQTVLGSASGLNQYGTTLTVTLRNVTAGQQFYVKVNGADTTAFSTGAYALTLNFGSGPAPTVPLPNTELLDGNPIQFGGGQPDIGPGGIYGSPEATANVNYLNMIAQSAVENASLFAAFTSNSSQASASTGTTASQGLQFVAALANHSDAAMTSNTATVVVTAAPLLTSANGNGFVATSTQNVVLSAKPMGYANLAAGSSSDKAMLSSVSTEKPLSSTNADEILYDAIPLASDEITPSSLLQGSTEVPACDACFADGEWTDSMVAVLPGQRDSDMVQVFSPAAAAASMAIILGGYWSVQAEEPEKRKRQPF